MNWSNVNLVFRREVRDQLRDRRTLFMIAILPLLLYPLLGFSFFQIAQFMQEHPTRVIVIGRGSVQQEECDVMGHMNVRHYVARVTDALAWLLLEAGLPPSRTGFAVQDQHIRFLREMSPGTPFAILGGLVVGEGPRTRCFAEIRNSATGDAAATFVTDILCTAAVPRAAFARMLEARIAAGS